MCKSCVLKCFKIILNCSIVLLPTALYCLLHYIAHCIILTTALYCPLHYIAHCITLPTALYCPLHYIAHCIILPTALYCPLHYITILTRRRRGSILQLLNKRVLEDLKTFWWDYERKECPKVEDESDGISIKNIGGVFLVIFIGRYTCT